MNINKPITTLNRTLSVLCVVLFCWLIYPAKWIRTAVFRVRRNNAILQADRLYAQTGKAAYVVQNGTRFLVGNRATLRNWNKQVRKGKQPCLDIDYRHAIIYKTTA